MQEEVKQRREIATLVYENAGREITQVFDVMNSNLALAAGTLAALLAVLGAGELFAQAREGTSSQVEAFPQLSPVSLIVLAAATPLVIRFFVRSMTAYQNLLRFNDVQKAAWGYLTGVHGWTYFKQHNEVYWVNWRTPKSMRRVIWENLKYGFMWIGVVMLGAVGYALWSTDNNGARLVAGLILALGIGWELGTFVGLHKRYYTPPTDQERQQLESLKCEPGEGKIEAGSTQDEEAPLAEQSTGVFLGTRRLFRRQD